MALNKAPESMIEIFGTTVKDFGAVGDGVTDDTAAIQSWIDSITAACVDSTGNDSALTVFDFGGGVYAVSSTLNFTLRGSLIKNATLKASGLSFTDGDFVVNITGPHSELESIRVYCSRKCSGININAGRVKVQKCEVFEYKSYGIFVPDTSGPEVWIDQSIIGELDPTFNPSLFTDNANYVGTGIEIRKSDCKVSNTIVRWTRCCYRATAGIQDIYNCHFYNGGVALVQRTNSQIIDWTASGTGELSIANFYHDNGYSEFYNDRVNISDIRIICDVDDMVPTAILKFYAYAADCKARCNIRGVDITDWDTSASLIDFVSYSGNNWSPLYTNVETFIDGVIDATPNNNNLSIGNKNIQVSFEAHDDREFWMTSGGTFSRLGFSDSGTTSNANSPYIGSNGNNFVLGSTDTFFRSRFLGVRSNAANATISSQADNGYNARFILNTATTLGGSTYDERGAFLYDNTSSSTRLRFGPSTGLFITSGAGSPEGVITAPIGSLYLQSDGTSRKTLFIKESGSGNTGWVSNAIAAYELIESTSADATAGPVADYYRNSSSPAANDLLGRLLFRGKDSAGNSQDYAAIQSVLDSPTSGSETGSIVFATTTGGTLTNQVRVNSDGNLEVFGGGKIGYATGSGGTVTQLTSKATSVTINKTNGSIVTHNDTLGNGSRVFFTVNNNKVEANDVIIAHRASGGTANGYEVLVMQVASGSFGLEIINISGGSLSEAITINFAVIKAVTA